MKHYSQNCEDIFILDLFKSKKKENCFFFEFGAWDGIHLSNCKLLAENNWSGFFIEGDYNRFQECAENYKRNNKTEIQYRKKRNDYYSIISLFKRPMDKTNYWSR